MIHAGDKNSRMVQAVYVLTLMAWIASIAFPAEARQLFYFVCGLALLAWLLDRRLPKKEVWVLLAILMLYAIYRLGYTVIDANTFRPQNDSEQVSIAIAQRFLMGCFLIGYLSTHKELWRHSWVLYAISAALTIGLFHAGYIDFILEQTRGERGQKATIFSYEVVALYLVFFGIWLEQSIGCKWRAGISLWAVTLLALTLVLWTQTRSALLSFLFGSVLLIALSLRPDKWRIFSVWLLLSGITVAVAYPWIIQPRLFEAKTNISQYVSNENRATSLGIRFELWRAGWRAFEEAPWFGGGYERRAALIDNAVADGAFDPALQRSKKVHVHNEIIEELSLRGLVGGGLLVTLYGYLFFLALTRVRGALPLLGLVSAYFFSGLTDVLFFSREATVVFLLSLALLMMQPSQDR
jgi:O-antigen ligase